MLKLNDLIADYIITKEINTGGFCNAYFAKKDGNTYFLKEYSDPKESDINFKAFFDNQTTIIDRLNSMGSITEKFVDHFVEGGVYYQVKEKLDGMDLVAYLDTHGEYKDRILLSIIFCGIIRNLHSQNIIHQDLKPGQVMLVDDDIGRKTKLGYRIILSDFDWSVPDGNVVQIVGTTYYKSPEHYRNETPQKKSDIFTLGVMIFEFLTGQNPYDFDDEAGDDDIRKRVLNKKIYREPIEINDEISKDANDILLRCLETDPEHRPDIDEIQKILLGKKSVSGVTKPDSKAKQIMLISGDNKLIIYGDKELFRRDFKVFFSTSTDNAGNPLYKYCEKDNPMLSFSTGSDDSIYISAPVETRNYFMLNNVQIKNEKLNIKSGDELQLFSAKRGGIVGKFDIK